MAFVTTVQEALDLAERYLFGAEPGRLPAVLHQALTEATDGRDRVRLAAALGRCWAYAGEPDRAVTFADSAMREAETLADPALLAEAVDASLAAHWGVDELDLRRTLARRLDEVTAHITDGEARLRAHGWLLTVACESLDVAAMNRQVRALEVLGEQSARALGIAASRRLMLDLLRGRTDTIDTLVGIAERALAQAPEPDGVMMLGAMRGYGAVIAADKATAAQMAALAEELADAEGIRELYAESAWLWLGAGDVDHARDLAERFDADVLASLPKNFNYLLVHQLLLEVALAADARELVERFTQFLLPYPGRAVINAGAVMFHGVTDDTLSRALIVLGRPDEGAILRERALATYRRIGARWWSERLERSPAASVRTLTMYPGREGVWLVGSGSTVVAVPARRGLEYLHALISHPGTDIGAESLVNRLEVPIQRPAGPVLDEQAIRAYRARLAAIDAETDDADLRGDEAWSRQLSAERDALVAELAAATGLGGRRRATGGSQERARVAVKKAISAALDALRSAAPPLAAHLGAHVSTGLSCRYDPDPEVVWHLHPHPNAG